MKTNAVRLLDSLGVSYELRDYEVDPQDLAAESVAAKIGMPPEQVFKTLLAHGDRNGNCFAIVPGNSELDLKALASRIRRSQGRACHAERCSAAHRLHSRRGNCSRRKEGCSRFADETIEMWDKISISAGIRGTQIILKPEDYLRVTGAVVADIAKGK